MKLLNFLFHPSFLCSVHIKSLSKAGLFSMKPLKKVENHVINLQEIILIKSSLRFAKK